MDRESLVDAINIRWNVFPGEMNNQESRAGWRVRWGVGDVNDNGFDQ